VKLTAKFFLLFSCIILFMGYISFYGIYRFQYQILEKEITEKLENAAEAHLDRLDRMFYERLSDLELLSKEPAFRASKIDPRAVRRELDTFLSRYPQYASVTFFDMDRHTIASAGPSSGKYRQHPLTEYWPDIYAGKNHVVNISRSAALDVPTLHFADRVLDATGQTIGILVSRIPASEMYGLMESQRNGKNMPDPYSLDILGADGTVLYSNHYPEQVLNAIDEDYGLIQDALPAVRTVTSLTDIHRTAHSEEKKVILVFAKEQGYHNFKGNGWILKVMYGSDEAFAPLSDLNQQVFLFLLAVSVVGIATLLGVVLYTVVRPIRKLNKATTRLGEGALETRVALDTHDEIGLLGRSFNTMATNLKEARAQLADAAENALARARLAEHKIIEISEETQQQIGRELHDDLGQQLTGVAFMAEVMSQHLKQEGHSEAGNAAKITTLINEAINKAHNLAQGLHPVELKESGLAPMLLRLAANTESIYGIKCSCQCPDNLPDYAPLEITNIFRIVQEAVHNAVKHSDASKIDIELHSDEDGMLINITDNGRGIGDTADLEARSGMGMHTMNYRASLLNGTLEIYSMPGGGTQVALTLPPPRA